MTADQKKTTTSKFLILTLITFMTITVLCTHLVVFPWPITLYAFIGFVVIIFASTAYSLRSPITVKGYEADSIAYHERFLGFTHRFMGGGLFIFLLLLFVSAVDVLQISETEITEVLISEYELALFDKIFILSLVMLIINFLPYRAYLGDINVLELKK